jgi:hypothetical protein
LKVDLSEIDRAKAEDDRVGFLKLNLGKKRRIIGATLVGEKAGEMIPAAVIAINRKLTVGIFMNMIVAAMVTGPSTKPAGFLDRGLHMILDPLLNLVQGNGYNQWFLIMAFLHPLAWLFLKFGGIQKLSIPGK